jgi:hypothetical protein
MVYSKYTFDTIGNNSRKNAAPKFWERPHLNRKNEAKGRIRRTFECSVYLLVKTSIGDIGQANNMIKRKLFKNGLEASGAREGERKPIAEHDWNRQIDLLIDEIGLRRYSRKTLKNYRFWARKFSAFVKDKNPEEITSDDAI